MNDAHPSPAPKLDYRALLANVADRPRFYADHPLRKLAYSAEERAAREYARVTGRAGR